MYSQLVLKSGPPAPELSAALLALWEDSVRASHTFLSEDDIRAVRPDVIAAFGIVSLFWLEDAAGAPHAFMGIHEDKLEMLFVAPDERGNGLGRRLLEHAVGKLGVRRVDVNEQNPRAQSFYQRMGFRQIGRSAHDSQGRPFPLLHLEYAKTGSKD